MAQPPLQIYLAGTCTFGVAKGQSQYYKVRDDYKDLANTVQHRLESYHYVGKDRKINEMRNAGVKVFLDSGAYSAFTLGQTIGMDDYCSYIHKNRDLIRVEDGLPMISVLDSIGDERKTYENQLEMERQGIRPLPTFHAGEDEGYLEWYIANYDYISLGGMVGQHTKQLQIWLDRMWDKHLLDGAGDPKIRVHGFGITSVPLMERYPWYSCDSSSWIQTTSYGGVFVPGYGNIDVSNESPSRHTAGHHITTLTPPEQWHLYNLFKAQGFDPSYVVNDYYGRVTYNIWAYQEMEKIINQKKATEHRKPLPKELF